MKFKVFFVEKVIPNFFVWLMAYIVVGRILLKWLSSQRHIDWSGFADVSSLLVFLGGVILAIGIAYVFAKGSAQLVWFYAKVREEAATALVNFSSIALIVGIGELLPPSSAVSQAIPLLVLAPFGFLLAWRAL